VFITFEQQSQHIFADELRAIMQAPWASVTVDDPETFLAEVLADPTHACYAATVAKLRDICVLWTPEARSATFSPRWETQGEQRHLLVDLVKRATTKGRHQVVDQLVTAPPSLNAAYLVACALTWQERQASLEIPTMVALQPAIQSALASGETDHADLHAVLKRLLALPGVASDRLPDEAPGDI
jgi:hypothetical protein